MFWGMSLCNFSVTHSQWHTLLKMKKILYCVTAVSCFNSYQSEVRIHISCLQSHHQTITCINCVWVEPSGWHASLEWFFLKFRLQSYFFITMIILLLFDWQSALLTLFISYLFKKRRGRVDLLKCNPFCLLNWFLQIITEKIKTNRPLQE